MLTDVLSAFELCTEAIANRQVFNRGTHEKLGRFSSVLQGHCAGIFPGYASIIEERKGQLREVLGLRPEDQIIVDPNIPPPLLPNNSVISTPDHSVDNMRALGPSIELPKNQSPCKIFPNENNSPALRQELSQDSEIDRLLRRFPDMDRDELSMLVDETRQFHGESLTDEALFEAIEEFRRVEGFSILAPMESNTAGKGLEGNNSSKGATAETKTLVDDSVHDIFVELLQNMSASRTQGKNTNGIALSALLNWTVSVVRDGLTLSHFSSDGRLLGRRLHGLSRTIGHHSFGDLAAVWTSLSWKMY